MATQPINGLNSRNCQGRVSLVAAQLLGIKYLTLARSSDISCIKFGTNADHFRTCMRILTVTTLAVALLSQCMTASAASTRKALARSTVAEVPAKAADLVAEAKVSERDAVTTDVVKWAVKSHPSVTPAVVGAIARKTPGAASVAASVAAALQPKQAKLIAQAAVAAAPDQAGQVVKAVCKAVPSAYREVATAASAAAPSANREILLGVAAALPNLQGKIDSSLAAFGTTTPSVTAVLDSTSGATSVASVNPAPVRGPTIGGPYVPLSGTATNAPPGNNLPPGGRDYAAP
ncbi:MAG: hypothetical protein IH623_29400 [Verrucomicrobia bacterium]|nr:hypothetical protein [Verrucomicrobiota bacterium]